MRNLEFPLFVCFLLLRKNEKEVYNFLVITMEKASISKIYLTGKVWKRILLFQSIKQFNSYLISVSVAIFLVFFITFLIKYENPINSARILYVVAFSTAFGALLVVAGALRSKFTIHTTDNLNQILDLIDNQVRKLGYTKVNPASAVYTYQTEGPTWLKWDENSISLYFDSKLIIVNGPIFTLRILHSRLLSKTDKG